MTLSEFIQRLQLLEQQGHGEKPVAVADWSEAYSRPSQQVAETIEVYERQVVIGAQ
jgi:hypothetical protein